MNVISKQAGLMLLMLVLMPAWTFASEKSPDKPDKESTDDAASDEEAVRTFKLPGLTANLDENFVDVDATVCLDQGYLELIACTKQTKEHESLVAVEASPRHIHAALLLIGAVNGHPAMRKQIGDEENPRWVHLPPRGEKIKVSLVIPDARGNENAFPISDFVMHIDEDDMAMRQVHVFDDAEPVQFPSEFLFAGSHLVDQEEGESQYIADVSGHVITIATFGDELLCLPGHHSAANGELVWQVNPDMLPKVGTKVKLRLERLVPEEMDDEPAKHER